MASPENKLTEREQEVLRLYGQEGFSAKEIGRKFKITPQRVLQIIKGARAKTAKRPRVRVPVVFVEVAGGVADAQSVGDVETIILDRDNLEDTVGNPDLDPGAMEQFLADLRHWAQVSGHKHYADEADKLEARHKKLLKEAEA
jgi:hypothetical protein